MKKRLLATLLALIVLLSSGAVIYAGPNIKGTPPIDLNSTQIPIPELDGQFYPGDHSDDAPND